MNASGSNGVVGKDRRPLKVRQAGFWVPLATRLAGMGVTPNIVSLIGLTVGVLSGLFLSATRFVDPGILQRALWILSIACIMLRGGCNILDGVIAVETGQLSPTGILWNEVPDRISDVATLLGAGYADGGEPVLGWLAAIIAVLVAYVRAQCRVAGAPMDFCGPMAKPMRMLCVSLGAGWMAVTPTACQPRFGAAGKWGVQAVALLVVNVGGIVTIIRRLSRAARHLSGKQQ